MSNIIKKNINSPLKFVYSDNNTLSVIFHDNDLLMGVVGEFNKNLKELEKKDLSQTLNDLSMASPFSLEEKQILLESLDINVRKEKMEQILNNYIKDEFENTTLQ